MAFPYWQSVVTGAVVLFLPFMMSFFRSKDKFDVGGKTVLLTGASEGMGKAVAEILAAKGANIVIVARNIDKLKRVVDDLRTKAPYPAAQKFHYISADVSKAGEAERILSEATTWNDGNEPDIVWCIAGAAVSTLFLDSSPETMRKQMDLNYWSCADMAHAVLGRWLAPGSVDSGKKRHLIFTSSVVAFLPIVGYGPYAPAKMAIRALSDTLSQEVLLYTHDVKIHTIFPGTITSPGLLVEDITKPEITKILEKDDPRSTPEEVAKKSVAGLEAGDNFVTVNLLGSALRGCNWGGSTRNNWLIDTMMTIVTALAWYFISWDITGKVVKYGQKHGHPSSYRKQL